MIDIKKLRMSDPCPCGLGILSTVDVRSDYFVCADVRATGNVYHDHMPMPSSGPGFYTNVNNVAVTPRVTGSGNTFTNCTVKGPPRSFTVTYGSINGLAGVMSSTAPDVDRAKYPHTCPTCKGAVYVGFTAIEHAVTGDARCP